MNQSALSNKIFSILQNDQQDGFAESINNYIHYQSEKITPDLLELVWEHTNDGMLLTDSDGIIVAVNTAFCSLVNMKENELLKLPFTVIYDKSVDRKQIFEEYKKIAAQNNYSSIEETNFYFNSGRSVTVEKMTTTLVDAAHEAYVLSEFRDISERKRWEQSLNESENRYRSLFENSVLPIYESNVSGKFINANVALLHLLGYDSFDELLSLNLERDVYVNVEQRVKLFEKLIESKSDTPAELDLKKKDGTIITVLAHSRIIMDGEGSITGFEGALEDITERKMLEQKLQSNIRQLETAHDDLTRLNTQKDKILAIVSHDLRSPFSSILGFCELLKNEFHTLSDEEKLEFVGYIHDAAAQQLTMVNSILDWSKLETGRVTVKFQTVNVGIIAGEIVITMLGLAKQKNVEIQSNIPAGTFVHADEQLFRQLLLNLVGNALKFTPRGGTITIELREDSSGQLQLSVKDTGIGIPNKDLGKLFKVEEKYTRQGLQGEVGTGLGLPMCYEIMKKHHGSIDVESEEGKGTTFILKFQKRNIDGCKKILIVDDQKGNRLILSRFMKRIAEGSESIFAETGKEAMKLLETERPDVILTDYHMPEMDGLEFIRQIRSNEMLKNTPVILISGDNMDHFESSDPLTNVLQKPVVFQCLSDVMGKIRF